MLNIEKKIDEIYHIPNRSIQTISSLEGLRAIAAIMVFVVHYMAQFTPWINQESLTWQLIIDYRFLGAKGVELFFVISGFLIYGILIEKKPKLNRYISRRVFRLYPTFIAVLSIYLALSFLFPSESKLPSESIEIFSYLLSNFLMLPGIFNIEPMMGVAWTLSYEMFLYLTLPIFLFVMRFHHLNANTRILTIICISVISFVLVHFEFQRFDKMILFLAGMLVFELKHKNYFNLKNPYILLFSFLALLAVKHMSLDRVFMLLTLYIGFSLVLYACMDNSNQFSQLCTNKYLRYFGNMSYSYYLIHGITLKFFFLVLNIFYPAKHQWDLVVYFWCIPVFILTCITSTCLFLLVEKPFSFGRK